LIGLGVIIIFGLICNACEKKAKVKQNDVVMCPVSNLYAYLGFKHVIPNKITFNIDNNPNQNKVAYNENKRDVLVREIERVEQNIEKLEIESKVVEKFGIFAQQALNIIECESNFNVNALNTTSGSSGLFQIIPRWHEDKIAGRDIMNVDVNIDVAYQIFNEQGWNPWECNK
jgi:hypothetical protein